MIRPAEGRYAAPQKTGEQGGYGGEGLTAGYIS